MRYPSPFLAARNSPITTPTRHNPMFTFILPYDRRNGTGQDDLCQGVSAVSVEGVDQLDLFLIHCGEAGVQVHDASEESHGHSGYDDRGRRSAEPDDKQRSKGGFWQAVQNHHIGLQYLREPAAAPQQDCGENADKCDKKKTGNCFIEGYPYMKKDGTVHYHFPETHADLDGLLKMKEINKSCVCADFPKKQEQDQNRPRVAMRTVMRRRFRERRNNACPVDILFMAVQLLPYLIEIVFKPPEHSVLARGVSFSRENDTGRISDTVAAGRSGMIMRSARLTASERSWVTRRAVFPDFRMICPISSLTFSLV